jgi:beta-galactosidase
MRFRTILLCCGLFSVETWCRAADRPSVDLTGEWEFKLDPLDVGRIEKWFDPSVAYDRKIHVPGAWNAQGVAFESKEQLRAYEDRRLVEQKDLNKRGMLGSQRESDRLFHAYPGPAWYRRRVSIPADWKGKIPWVVFTGVHREAEVWVDGKLAGSHRSYLTPFRIDLSQPPISAQAGETITIAARVDARRNREVDPLMGCLDTLDFLYATWGGLHQPVRLEAATPTRVDDVFVVPHLENDTAEIRVAIAGPKTGKLKIVAQVFDQDGAVVKSADRAVAPEAPETALAVHIANPKLWSPQSPHLYTASIQLFSEDAAVDQRTVRFGMREFKVAGGKFLLNGKPIFLRGYGDDCIFPNTICPPTDKNELRSRLALARDYGFNFARHHSWTPPEAYLDAADELGMMLQPEFPFAYAWDLPTSPETRRAALEQWQAVIRLNRNHPSIVTWCMGNEQYNSFDIAPAMDEAARRLDPTRPIIDSDGCSFKHATRESLDYLVVQFGEGDSIGHQDRKYDIPASIAKPVIGHEMGYFVTLPDLAQIDRFKGGLRPYWLEQTRELATKNGLLVAYPDWLAASYRLQAACLKSNLEAARRSRLSGTSVWLFQDYPNCAEGVVGMFGQPKGLSAEEFRKFNAPTVLLLDVPRRNWWSGEIAELTFVVSRFEDAPSRDATLRWRLHNGSEAIAHGEQSHLAIRSGEVQELATIKLNLPGLTRASRLTVSAELADADVKVENSWDLWVFPRVPDDDTSSKVRSVGFEPIRTVFPNTIEHKDGPIPSDTGLLIATRLDDNITRYLEGGGSVFLLDPEPSFAVERTNFRLSSWDGGGPSGTIINLKHPALSDFPSDGWCDLQFYPLIQKSKTILLTALPAKIEPLVRCIDRPTRLADRAYLFEVSVGSGKLLVSGFNFGQALKSRDPAAIFLFDRLVRYALGSDFKPKASLPVNVLRTKGAK